MKDFYPKPAIKTLERLKTEFEMESQVFEALVNQFMAEVDQRQYYSLWQKSRSMLQMCQYTRQAMERFIEAKYSLSPSRIIRWPFTDLFEKLFPAGPEGNPK